MELTKWQLAVKIQRDKSVFASPSHGGRLGHGRSVTNFIDDAKYRTCRIQTSLGSIPKL